MPGERPSHIPPENPFGSQEGKLPPEPTEQFVGRYLGKRGVGVSSSTPDVATDLSTEEDRAARENVARDELGSYSKIYAAEGSKLRELFGHEVKIPDLPPEVTLERVQEWREISFGVHYLPRIEIAGNEPGLTVPLAFIGIDQGSVDPFGPNQLTATELPGAWVLVDERPKPSVVGGQHRYERDTELEQLIARLRQGEKPTIQPNWTGGQSQHTQRTRANPDESRFGISWEELHKKQFVSAVAHWLDVPPHQVRLPRAIEYNVLGNMHHPEWGQTNASEWFEDSYDDGEGRMYGGSAHSNGLADIDGNTPDDRHWGIGFRLIVVLS